MGSATETHQDLHGMRILITDDEFLIAITIEETLRDAGAETVTAATLPAAMKVAADEPLSAALLDVRLGRQTTDAVADILSSRQVPFVFYTGQALPADMSRKYAGAEVLAKPARQDAIVEMMLKIVGR
jgi:CheY-like chemotaxis protein